MELYAVMKVLWWVLLLVLLTGIGAMVGMDMGVGTALRYLGRTNEERRAALNMIGPHWDGNQVWFILGGGAVFAAWPTLYAASFTGFYTVMMLLLWTMIVRPLGFEYRSRVDDPRWRELWDWGLFVSGAIPMVVFGVAVGNLFFGFPFHFDWRMQFFYGGSLLALFHPFALLCGLLSLVLSLYQGATMVMNRGEGVIYDRARRLALGSGAAGIVLFAAGGVWVRHLDGFAITSAVNTSQPANPLHKTVALVPGAWGENFSSHPFLWVVPALTVLVLLSGFMACLKGKSLVAWWMGTAAWAGTLGTTGASLFPFLLPSSSAPSQSLTVWDAGSSLWTLIWMAGFTVVFIPIILVYTSWAFWVMRGKVSANTIDRRDHAY